MQVTSSNSERVILTKFNNALKFVIPLYQYVLVFLHQMFGKKSLIDDLISLSVKI